MRRITMMNEDGERLVVSICDETVVNSGGFGCIYAVEGDERHVVKQVPLVPHEPVGNTAQYIAHIRTTRERLRQIMAEENQKTKPRRFIIDSIRNFIDQSLSTHWGFDVQGMRIAAVWYRQRIAPGRKLKNLFRSDPPSERCRILIALAFICRMRTLRRAGLVHLDCVSDNIFYDHTSGRLTLIDLDGCGVAYRTGRGGRSADQWDQRPLTLGHIREVRRPIWYPQIGIESGPLDGNYLFAERWVVVDTIIRILSWDRVRALSWLDAGVRDAIRDSLQRIETAINEAREGGSGEIAGVWRDLYKTELSEIRNGYPETAGLDLSHGFPSSLQRFIMLAHNACVSPEVMGSGFSPYELYRRWLA